VPEIDPNELASGHEASGVAKDYQTILQESVKELAAFFEQLIGLLGQNYKYHLFLSDSSLLDVTIANDSDKTGESMQKPRQDVLSHYEQIEYFEDSLVFVSYFIGRFYAGADLDKTLSFLNLARKMSDDGFSAYLRFVSKHSICQPMSFFSNQVFNFRTFFTFERSGL